MGQVLKSVLSGYVATKLMTKCMYDIAPRMRLPKVDVAGAINTAGKKSEGNSKSEFDRKSKKEDKQPGMLVHYLLGSLIFPASYECVFKHLLPGNRLVKGVLWGAGLWGVGQTMVLPGLGKKPYFDKKPAARFTYFIVHMIYGIAFCVGAEGKKRSAGK